MRTLRWQCTVFETAGSVNRAHRLKYFRDQQGLEVDFVVPSGHQRLVFVEAKASRTVVPQKPPRWPASPPE